MLFDTVEFLSPNSKIVSPVVQGEMMQDALSAPSTPQSSVSKQYLEDQLVNKADVSYVNSVLSSGSIYDIAVYYVGSPTSLTSILKIALARALKLPVGLTGSVALAAVAATTTTIFTIKKNSTVIGTITFASGSDTGVISFTSEVSFAVGNVLEILAPELPDDTLSDITITLIPQLA